MGTNKRYVVRMFDHNYRVVIESQDGGKDIFVFGSDTLAEVRAAYEMAVSNNPDRTVLLMQGARIMERGAPKQ